MKNASKILSVVLVLSMMISIGCIGGNEITGYTVDVGFRDGSHETYKNIVDCVVVSEGIFSDTIELTTVYGEIITLHYVTSVNVRE